MIGLCRLYRAENKVVQAMAVHRIGGPHLWGGGPKRMQWKGVSQAAAPSVETWKVRTQAIHRCRLGGTRMPSLYSSNRAPPTCSGPLVPSTATRLPAGPRHVVDVQRQPMIFPGHEVPGAIYIVTIHAVVACRVLVIVASVHPDAVVPWPDVRRGIRRVTLRDRRVGRRHARKEVYGRDDQGHRGPVYCLKHDATAVLNRAPPAWIRAALTKLARSRPTTRGA